jgi:DNA-binding GntR family transcriptional regulator
MTQRKQIKKRNSPARKRQALPKAGKLSLAEQVYRELKRQILDNEIPASTVMLEEEIAELLSVSRTPVREATVRLAEEGIVEVRPRHGMRVLPVSAEDMRHIYDVLTALESEAARLVAEQGLPPSELSALKEAVEEMDAALKEDDLPRWAAADAHFHRRLLDNCPNPRLRNLVYQFWDQAHRARMVTLRLRPKPTASNHDHRALVKAIENADSEGARAIHRAHRVRHGQILVDILKTHGFRGL